MAEFKRKLYKRGSSYEITVPMPLLFLVDKSEKNEVIFKFDESKKKWYVDIKPARKKNKENSK